MPDKDEQQTTVYESGKDFVREQIKMRPVNRRKLLRRTLMTVSLAIVFGVVACVTFLLLEPMFNRAINPEGAPERNPVVFPEEPVEEEVPPEDLIADDSGIEGMDPQSAIDDYAFNAADFAEMYASLKTVAYEAQKSVVTVTSVTGGTTWSGDFLETSDTMSGLIVADNGYDLLALTDYDAARSAEELRVRFYDGTTCEAKLLVRDDLTNLCVLAIARSDLPQTLLEAVPVATLGASVASSIVGQPVVALGEPIGIADSVVYGMVTSAARVVSYADGSYGLLSTDIYAHPRANGALINTRGEVIGFYTPYLTAHMPQDAQGQLNAYGVSGIRRLVEKLSNGSARAYLGVVGADVPADVREEEGIPQGAYVSRIEMNAPAMVCGIQSGDVITKLDDTDILNYAALTNALYERLPGETVVVTLQRRGPAGYTEIEETATLGSVSE